MKRGTPESPKTLMLMQELNCCRVMAVGILESLWHTCARHAPDGRTSRYTPEILATQMGYSGDPGLYRFGLSVPSCTYGLHC